MCASEERTAECRADMLLRELQSRASQKICTECKLGCRCMKKTLFAQFLVPVLGLIRFTYMEHFRFIRNVS